MANTYLTRTPSSTGNKRTFTFSFWVKRNGLGLGGTGQVIYCQSYGSDGYQFKIEFTSNDEFRLYNSQGASDAINLKTNRRFRDISAWYAITIAIDTTQGTAADRAKIYVNGVQETSFGSATYPTQNLELDVNAAVAQIIGAKYSGSYNTYFDGSLSHFHFVDGTAYAASTFGSTDSTTSEWKIKTDVTATYGTNGFFILKDGNTITDQSSNSNDFSLGGGTLTNTEDNPSNVFATMNPLALYHTSGGTLSHGNTTYVWSNYQVNARSTLGMPKGKFYWEQRCNVPAAGDEGSNRIGMCTSAFTNYIDTDSVDAHYNAAGNGGIYLLMTTANTSWQRTNNDTSKNVDTYTNATALATGNIIMNAVDVDAGKYWVGINGTWFYSGNPATGSNPQITFTNSGGDDLHVFLGSGTNNSRSFSFNFGNGFFGTTAVSSAGTNASGNGVFEYDVPAGYTALSTKGLNE